MEEDRLEASACPVAHLNHLEAEILPNRVEEASGERNQERQKHCTHNCVVSVGFRAHQPVDVANEEQWSEDVLQGQREANEAELHEVPFVGPEDALQEGISVIWVLLDVVLNARFDVFCFVANFQAIW